MEIIFLKLILNQSADWHLLLFCGKEKLESPAKPSYLPDFVKSNARPNFPLARETLKRSEFWNYRFIYRKKEFLWKAFSSLLSQLYLAWIVEMKKWIATRAASRHKKNYDSEARSSIFWGRIGLPTIPVENAEKGLRWRSALANGLMSTCPTLLQTESWFERHC